MKNKNQKITPITVIIPTWKRTEQLREVLNRLLTCDPAPSEILVHVDAGDPQTPAMLAAEFSGQVRWMQSAQTQGPGGGRNLLIAEARFPLVASFDDDSWPQEQDFFRVAASVMAEHPKAAILAGQVTLRGQTTPNIDSPITEVSCYESGACVLRREAFLQTGRYLPLRYAYGMEEADVALQLLDAGWAILHVPALRVYHDTDQIHHTSPQVNAAHITNIALLTALRYPVFYWPLGLAQVLNRVRFALGMGRRRGVLAGLLAIPGTVRKYWQARKPVQPATISRSRKLARADVSSAY